MWILLNTHLNTFEHFCECFWMEKWILLNIPESFFEYFFLAKFWPKFSGKKSEKKVFKKVLPIWSNYTQITLKFEYFWRRFDSKVFTKKYSKVFKFVSWGYGIDVLWWGVWCVYQACPCGEISRPPHPTAILISPPHEAPRKTKNVLYYWKTSVNDSNILGIYIFGHIFHSAHENNILPHPTKLLRHAANPTETHPTPLDKPWVCIDDVFRLGYGP